jgi:hypothetical protein
MIKKAPNADLELEKNRLPMEEIMTTRYGNPSSLLEVKNQISPAAKPKSTELANSKGSAKNEASLLVRAWVSKVQDNPKFPEGSIS